MSELLSRLTPKVSSWEDARGGFGSITVTDICAALAGCDPLGELVLRRKYVNYKERGKGYLTLLKNSIFKIYEADKQPNTPNMIEPLLELALDDYIGYFLCPLCKGKRQVVTSEGKVHQCRSSVCVEGRAKRKDWQRAKSLGVKPLIYSRYYKSPYLIINRYLSEVLPEAETRAVNHLRKRLAD